MSRNLINFSTFDNHNYHGRWDRTEDGMMRSHWTVYFEFRIKAESFTMRCDRRTKGYSYAVDGNHMSGVGSGADLTFYLDPEKFHTIRITYGNGAFPMYFKGIETDGEVRFAPNKPKYSLFIGDITTTSMYSFSKEIIAAKQCDYDLIALTGIALCNGHGTYNENPVGMETAFSCLEAPKEDVTLTELNLKKLRVPDDIYVNLGLGDDLEDPANSENFKKTYVDFVQKLAKVWPKAKIYLLLPLVDTENGLRFDTVEAAAMETAATVKNAKFINARGLEIERAKDGINPSPAGYKTYSDFVLDKLKIKR